MDLPGLRWLLLELVGTAHEPQLGGLSDADWLMLDRMAVQHRLEPLLHAQHRHNSAVPKPVLARWQAAHRRTSMFALVQRAELKATVSLLEGAGFEPIALKGAWLAWHAYPEAAQRPLRDLDLLLDSASVLPAMAVLQAAGYRLEDAGEMTLEDCVRLDKHLPPLAAPRGTAVELHHRLWELDGRLDHDLPGASEAEVRRRAERADDGICHPTSEDMLVHLVIHALYSHRLDCGPLLLADIDFLLRASAVDWGGFWHRAAQEGWRDGARLVLELVARYRPEAPVELAGDPVDPALREAAVQLLLQDLETRRSAGFAAAMLKAGPGKLTRRLRGLNSARGETPVRRDMSGEGGRIGWASGRLLRTLRDLASTDVRRQSRDLARLSRWLDR